MNIKIYDNGGKTCDRFTIIIDGDVYGMSESPLQPNGFNEYWDNAPRSYRAAGDKLVKDIKTLPAEVRCAIAIRAGLV